MIARSSFKDALPVVLDQRFPEGATSAIYVGTGGSLSLVLSSGKAVVFTGVPGGIWFPVEATMVTSANTTASNLVAGYF